MENLKFTLLGFWIFLAACSENIVMNSSRWSQQGQAPSRPLDLNPKASAVSIGKNQVIFQSQFINGVEIEDSFYKEISTSEPEFIASNWAMNIPNHLKAQIMYLKRGALKTRNRIFKKFPEINPADVIQGPLLVIRRGELRWKLVLSTPGGKLSGIYLNGKLEIQSIENLGSQLDQATAKLFPEGPLASQLQKVLLSNLIDSRTLMSPKVRVMTQSDQVATSEDSQFIFPVEDNRFEQVQVFFYLTKALSWCEEQFNFKLPFVLEAETSVGYPEKTNTAFYYQHRIRFGDGDDEAFSRIPLDPSIVFHEAFHSVIDSVARLPFEGEGGSINEGFADFFTAVMTKNPKLGEASYKKGPYKRTIKNSILLTERTGGLYHDSGIVSGFFWSVQEEIGSKAATQFAWQTLLRLVPNTNFESLKLEVSELAMKLPSEERKKVISILQKRGWI